MALFFLSIPYNREEAYKSEATKGSTPEVTKAAKESNSVKEVQEKSVEEDVGPAIPAGFMIPSFADSDKKKTAGKAEQKYQEGILNGEKGF